MFEFCLHDEDILFDGGWLVIAFYLLWQSYDSSLRALETLLQQNNV
jgi:hypothetical protein